MTSTSRLEITSSAATELAEWLVKELERSDPTTNLSIDAKWRERRQHNAQEGRQLKAGHRDHFEQVINEKATAAAAKPLRALLDELAGRFGVSWVDISRMVGVSVPALRKWRRDQNGAAGENQRRLALLAGFCEAMEEAGAGEPARWLNIPFDADYTVRPRDVFSEETAPVLMDVAISSGDFREVLRMVDPAWRTRWARHFETVADEDGEYALVSRDTSSTHG